MWISITIIFIVLVVNYVISFQSRQIPTVAIMRALLLGKLKKLTVPALWRAKHDYFPRTLKLHNGEKVHCFFMTFKCLCIMSKCLCNISR